MAKTWNTLNNLNVDQKVLKDGFNQESRNSQVTKSSCETELRKMTSHFNWLNQIFYIKSSFGLLTRLR